MVKGRQIFPEVTIIFPGSGAWILFKKGKNSKITVNVIRDTDHQLFFIWGTYVWSFI